MEYVDNEGVRRKELLTLAPHGLVRTFEVVPPAEGKLTLRARALSGDHEDASAPVKLVVAASAPEQTKVAAVDVAVALAIEERLRAVCRASGGRFSTSQSPGAAVEGFIDFVTRSPREISAPVRRRDVVPTPALLALFVALLIAEWALRRAWGME